jgi:hypothetical protein
VTPHRRRRLGALVLALALAAGASRPGLAVRAGLPARLTDAEFWALIQDFSEPAGFFRSDNLVSNEDTFQVIVPELQRVIKPGGVYVGVGPDQNFTYIAATRPAIVFLPDIRRGNLHMHLMYKALMEQSADRADFLSRLFSRKRPEGLSAASTAESLFNAYAEVAPAREQFNQTLQSVVAMLGKRGFTLDDADVRGIEFILGSFFAAGPFLSYATGPAAGRSRYPSFAELQMATDATGTTHAYLASEENYRTVRALQQRNLIVPLVANFAGPKALRAIGAWVRGRDAKVTTFYASNVEQYLFQDGVWDVFAGNLGALPLDESGLFIRSCFNLCFSATFNSRVVMLLDSLPALVRDHKNGVIRGYYDVLSRQR